MDKTRRAKLKHSTATEQSGKPPSSIGEAQLAGLRLKIAPRTDIPLPPAKLRDTDHRAFMEWASWSLRKAEEPAGPLALTDAKGLAEHVGGLTPEVYEALQGCASAVKHPRLNRKKLASEIRKLQKILRCETPEAVQARIFCHVHVLPHFANRRYQPLDHTLASADEQQLASPFLRSENPTNLLSPQHFTKNARLSFAIQELARLYANRTGKPANVWGGESESPFQKLVVEFVHALGLTFNTQKEKVALSKQIERALASR